MKRYILCLTLLGVTLWGGVYAQVPSSQGAAEQWFQEGATYYKQGSYAAAKQALQRYLNRSAKSQNTEEAHYMLACCSYELQEQGRIVVLQRFLRNYPASRYRYRVWGLIGSAYYFEGDYEKAVDAFDKCRWNHLDTREAQDMLFRRSLSLLELGKMKESESSFAELQKMGTRYAVDCTYYLAYLSYKQGEFTKSLQDFLSLQDNDRYGKWSTCYAGDIYLKTKRYEEAVKMADRGLSSPSTDSSSWPVELKRIKGEALFRLDHYQEAVPLLKEYVTTVPAPSREAVYALGVSYLQSEAYSLSLEQLRKVVKPEDALAQNAWLHIGRAQVKMGDRVASKESFSKAIAMNYDASVREEASYNYALAVYEDPQSDFEQRVNAFERFLADYPQSGYKSKATTYLSEVYLTGKNYEAALRSIEKIASPDKQLLQTKQKLLLQLGTEALKGNEYNSAIQYFTRSLEFAGVDAQIAADAYYWRGEAYYRSGKSREAEKDFQNYLSKTQQRDTEIYPMAHYSMGYIAFNNKEYSRANTYFSQFLTLQKTSNPKLKADAYNRLGDCYYHIRDFNEAKLYYDKAAATDATFGDYALYQNAFMAGIQKDYPLKVSLLDLMLSSYPQSSHAPLALYEKGRAYVMLGKNAEAIQVYNQLVSRYPKTEAARKGAAEIGLLYYQSSRYPEAISAYKRVIETYPGTEEANQSIRDLKSVYVETNRVNEFVSYASHIGKGEWMSTSEQDSLLYESAERMYLQGNDRTKALKSLEEYIQQFPKGHFIVNARCYLTDLYIHSGQDAKALELFKQVAPQITDQNILEKLRMDILDVAYRQKEHAVLDEIARSSVNESGAKAHFLQCELLYNAGDYAQAEKQILDFIDRDGNYLYWIARHFILLSDTFVKLNKPLDAKQYLESLKQNYKEKDDIQERIATRLKNLN